MTLCSWPVSAWKAGGKIVAACRGASVWLKRMAKYVLLWHQTEKTVLFGWSSVNILML